MNHYEKIPADERGAIHAAAQGLRASLA